MVGGVPGLGSAGVVVPFGPDVGVEGTAFVEVADVAEVSEDAGVAGVLLALLPTGVVAPAGPPPPVVDPQAASATTDVTARQPNASARHPGRGCAGVGAGSARSEGLMWLQTNTATGTLHPDRPRRLDAPRASWGRVPR